MCNAAWIYMYVTGLPCTNVAVIYVSLLYIQNLQKKNSNSNNTYNSYPILLKDIAVPYTVITNSRGIFHSFHTFYIINCQSFDPLFECLRTMLNKSARPSRSSICACDKNL